MSPNDPGRSVALLDHTFEEAMALAREARDYLSHQGPADLRALGPAGRLAASRESMRLSARVAEIVAWLLVHKAVHAGELARAHAAEPHCRLGGRAVCRRAKAPGGEPLPERLAELLRRSRQIYERVARLDAMLDREPA